MEDSNVIDDTLNVTDPATETAEEKAARLEETNKKLYERAKKAEAEAKALKEKSQPISEPAKPSEILKAPEFRLSRQGFDEDEIDLIMRNGGPDILKNETHPITLGINAARTQRNAEKAAALASDSSGLSDIERKYTVEELRAMKPDELANAIGYVQK